MTTKYSTGESRQRPNATAILRHIKSGYYKSSKCEICGCSIMVQKRDGISHSLLRALAIANHVKTLHPSSIQ